MRRYSRRSIGSIAVLGRPDVEQRTIPVKFLDVVRGDVLGLAVRRADDRLDGRVLGQRAEFAAREVDGEMPGIVLALLAHRAADAGARRDGLRRAATRTACACPSTADS